MTARDKIFALAVAMKLSVNCTEALLSMCGYRFSNSPRDVVIQNHIATRKGCVGELNQLLADKALGMLQLKDEKAYRGRRRKR